MPSRTLPGLGLNGFWLLGEDAWKDGMDANLRLLSAVTHLSVVSATTALPGSPTPGLVYIVVDTDPTNPGDVAVYDGEVGAEAWVYINPMEGWRAWAKDTETWLFYDGADWITEATVSTFIGLTDVPADYTGDALKAVRVNAAETALEFYTPAGGGSATFIGLTDVPANYTGQAGRGVRVNAGATALEFYLRAFVGQSDTPANYTGQAGKGVRVNAGATALEFFDLPPAFSVITLTGATTLTNTHFLGNRIIEVNAASPVTLTLNTGLTGMEPLLIEQTGAGQVTIAGSATLRNRNGLKTAGQYGVISIIPKGSNVYTVAGDATP